MRRKFDEISKYSKYFTKTTGSLLKIADWIVGLTGAGAGAQCWDALFDLIKCTSARMQVFKTIKLYFSPSGGCK